MSRYGMTIDLDRCVGCRACVVACTIHNGLPKGVRYGVVLEQESGTFPQVTVDYLPTLCMHCANAACLEVCPTGATYRTDEGIVAIDAQKCIGCKACMAACPYDARQMLETVESNHADGPTAYEEEVFPALVPNTVMKCTFCKDRLAQGELPICVATCPAHARAFGDLDDPESAVSKAIAAGNPQTLLADEETEPSVFYLSRKGVNIDAIFATK